MADLTLCFPIYNKAFAIDEVLQSFSQRADLSRCVFCVFDNGSTDKLQSKLEGWKKRLNLVVKRHDNTLPVTESWYQAIRMTQTEYFKLCLGDDPCVADPTVAMDHLQDTGCDYVTGKTKIRVMDDDQTPSMYFDMVHNFRRRIAPDLTPAQKTDMLTHQPISWTVLGDVNSFIFHRRCLSILPDCGRSYNGHLGPPDYEWLLRCFLAHRGCYLDQTIGAFDYNATSPTMRRHTEPMVEAHFKIIPLTMMLELLVDPFFKRHLVEPGRSTIQQMAIQNIVEGIQSIATEPFKHLMPQWLDAIERTGSIPTFRQSTLMNRKKPKTLTQKIHREALRFIQQVGFGQRAA